MSELILSGYFPLIVLIAYISAYAGEVKAFEHRYVKIAALILLVATVLVRPPVEILIPLVICSVFMLVSHE